jgi:hypothetical protein
MTTESAGLRPFDVAQGKMRKAPPPAGLKPPSAPLRINSAEDQPLSPVHIAPVADDLDVDDLLRLIHGVDDPDLSHS